VEGDGHRAHAIIVRIFMKEDLHVSHRRADASLWDMSSLSPEFSKQRHDTCNIRERRFEVDEPLA
jgi:hypothetical protein